MSKHLEVLGYDDKMNTIFAKGVNGSIMLDVIPDAVCLLKSCPSVERLYMQDYNEVEVLLTQESTIESAIEAWCDAVDKKRGTYKPGRNSQVPVQTQHDSSPAFYL